MARELIAWLAGSASALALAVALDFVFGDPEYRWHPVRLVGATLTAFETRLRAWGLDGRGGGIALFLLLVVTWGGVLAILGWAVTSIGAWPAWIVHAALVYSLLALGDLVLHVRRVDAAASRGNEAGARVAIAQLVGRDTDRMDVAACRRASIESLSENLTDGFTSPLFFYALGGLPGLLLFKIVSTMDSMVGYKTPRYLDFGWCGARLDDVLNFVPARLTWLLIAAIAAVVPGASARKAFACGLRQHSVLPGPNSGWSEAATAGAIQRRLVGPIWMKGAQVTAVWIGDPLDPPAGDHADVLRALRVVVASGLVAAGVVLLWLAL
ncbi:MAG: adenosylcobinamide-phosphate synthase CbiB [Acidobacteriota bacterium]